MKSPANEDRTQFEKREAAAQEERARSRRTSWGVKEATRQWESPAAVQRRQQETRIYFGLLKNLFPFCVLLWLDHYRSCDLTVFRVMFEFLFLCVYIYSRFLICMMLILVSDTLKKILHLYSPPLMITVFIFCIWLLCVSFNCLLWIQILLLFFYPPY